MEMSQRNSRYSHLKQRKMSFLINREQESKTSPVWGLTPVEGGECGKGVGG
jgi:hypothetical protein